VPFNLLCLTVDDLPASLNRFISPVGEVVSFDGCDKSELRMNEWLNWSERRDLNPGPPVPQTGALTGLRYAPPTRRKVYAGPALRARPPIRPQDRRLGRSVSHKDAGRRG